MKGYFYKEPRLYMTHLGRVIVRSVSYLTYGVVIALALVLFLSDLNILKAVGVMIGLFLLDMFFHYGMPERLLVNASTKHPNIKSYLLPETYKVIESVYERTLIHGGDFYLRLLEEMLKKDQIYKVFIRLDIRPKEVKSRVSKYLEESRQLDKISKKELIKEIEELVVVAMSRALPRYGVGVSLIDLLSALSLVKSSYLQKIFTLFDIGSRDLEIAFIFGQKSKNSLKGFLSRGHQRRGRVMNRAWTAKPTKELDKFSIDYTNLSKSGEGGLLIGHKNEYERMESILSRLGSANVLLIGDSGAGKDALVRHLAFQISRDRASKSLFDKRVVSLVVSEIFTGVSPDIAKGRLKKALEEIVTAKNVILYIPDIHLLFSASNQLTGADVLLPLLKQEQFSVIGATGNENFKEHIEKNEQFSNLFERVVVEQMGEEEAVEYLIYIALIIERDFRVVITFNAIKKAVNLAKRYITSRPLPGSAEEVIRDCISEVVKKEGVVVREDDVVSIVERRTKIKIAKTDEIEAQELLNLEEVIHERYINQVEAVKAVSDVLRAYRSGLINKGGPIGSFLFVGPTGVGKTELSKILADIQFGSEGAMRRFDMSEYQSLDSLYRFIGTPDGGKRGELTEVIKENPYSLILLDEFEKANKDILNLFLQVLDDGRLTDSSGRVVDFSNTMIIATSNAHSEYILESIKSGVSASEISENLKRKLIDFFKPELLNRFSKIVVFKGLGKEELKQISRLKFQSLKDNLMKNSGVDLKIEEAVYDFVVDKGYSPEYGARPLQRVIDEEVRPILVEKILKNQLEKGSSVTLDILNGLVVIR